MLKKRTLKQSLFDCILQIDNELSQMPILMGINRFLDYFVLIIASITLDNKNLIRQIPLLAEINAVIKNVEILGILSYVSFGLGIVMVMGCGLVLVLRRRKEQDGFGVKQFGGMIIQGTAWVTNCYQMVEAVYLYVLAKNTDLSQFQSNQFILFSSNILFFIIYTYIFSSRKFLGIFLTFFFLFQLFLSTIIAYICTLTISLYLLSSSYHETCKFIYLQIIFLKSINFISIILQIQIQMTYLRTVSNAFYYQVGVIIIFPVISYLYYFNNRFEQIVSFQSGQVLKIGLKMRDKGWKELSNRQIIILRSFYLQSGNTMELQQPTNQTFYAVFMDKMQKQIATNPKNIRSYIYKLQLNYKANKSMLKILHELQALNMFQASKLSEQYQIYTFTVDMINRYKISNTSNYHQLQQNDQRIENNQSKVVILLKEILALWQYIKKSDIDQKIIMQILSKIDVTRKQIQSNIIFFEGSDMRNYLLINQYAIKCLYPQYQMKNIQQDNKRKPPTFQRAASYYVLLINGKVDSISFNLAKKLGLDPFFIKNLTKQDIFPSFLRNQQQISLQNMGKQGEMPIILVNSESNMQVFIGKTSIFHMMGQRLCYFLHLQEIDQQNQPYLLINTSFNIVEYKSANFDKYFMNQRGSEKIDIDALFCHGFLSFKASKQLIGQYQIKLSQTEKKFLKIQKICTFQRGTLTYLLIKIYITKNIVKNSKLNLFIEHSISKRSGNKWQAYEKQFFFCRIPHPFEIKYNQVLEHIEDKERVKTSNIITTIFIVILIVILGCFVSVKVILQVKDEEFLSVVDQIITVNEAKNNMILLYQQCYKLFYFRQNNVTFTTSHIGSNKTITEIYIDQIKNLIKILQNFKYTYHKQVISLLSTRKFELFEVSTNIKQTTAILDILQFSKTFLINNNLLFLVQNFRFISQFQHSLQINHFLTQKVIEVQATIKYIFITCIVFITIVIILTYFYMYRSRRWGRHALKMMINYPQAMIDSTIQTLNNFQTFITNNQSVYYSKNSQYFQEESVSELVVLVEKQRQKEVNSQQQLRRKDAQYVQQPNLVSNKGNQDQYLHNIVEKNIIYQGVTVFLLKNFYFMITIFAIIIYFLRFQAVNTQISVDKLNIMGYIEGAYEIQRNILTQSVAVYQKALQNYYNIQNTLSYRPNSLATSLQQDLPIFFKDYQHYQKRQFQENLCLGTLSIKNGIYFKEDDCMVAIMGALKNGISIAYSSYVTKINDLYEQTTQEQRQFIIKRSHIQQLSFLDLAERLMYQRIQDLKMIYKGQVQSFINKELNQRLLLRILQEVTLIVVVCITWYLGIIKHKNRCNIMVNSFKMLRKDYILSKFLLKYCKKNYIFQNIIKL